jgi:hypothetical protein
MVSSSYTTVAQAVASMATVIAPLLFMHCSHLSLSCEYCRPAAYNLMPHFIVTMSCNHIVHWAGGSGCTLSPLSHTSSRVCLVEVASPCLLCMYHVLQLYCVLGWWEWMYLISPFTYFIEGLLGQGSFSLPSLHASC